MKLANVGNKNMTVEKSKVKTRIVEVSFLMEEILSLILVKLNLGSDMHNGNMYLTFWVLISGRGPFQSESY